MPTAEQQRERRAADKRALDAGDEGALKRRDAHATRMREARMVEKAKRAENDAAACGRAKKDKERMVEARRTDKLALEEGDDDALERSAKDKFRSETVQAANKLIEEIVREEAKNVLVEYVEAEYHECMKCIESFRRLQVDIDKNVQAYKSFEEVRHEVYEVHQSHASMFLRNSWRLSFLRERAQQSWSRTCEGKLVAEPLYQIWQLHEECEDLLKFLDSHDAAVLAPKDKKYGRLLEQAHMAAFNIKRTSFSDKDRAFKVLSGEDYHRQLRAQEIEAFRINAATRIPLNFSFTRLRTVRDYRTDSKKYQDALKLERARPSTLAEASRTPGIGKEILLALYEEIVDFFQQCSSTRQVEEKYEQRIATESNEQRRERIRQILFPSSDQNAVITLLGKEEEFFKILGDC
jgi:hypothetical protein